jgi:hypothetical protein
MTERRVDLGPAAGRYILCLKYWPLACALVFAVIALKTDMDAQSLLLVGGALAVLALLLAVLTWRLAIALRGMQAVVGAQEVKLTLPTWGQRLGPALPLVEVRVSRHDIEAVEVGPDPNRFGLARKAELVLKNGQRVPVWRHTEGLRKQWLWSPGKGAREHTAATYVQTSAGGVTWEFRLMGALFGFAERLAAALDVPYRNRLTRASP